MTELVPVTDAQDGAAYRFDTPVIHANSRRKLSRHKSRSPAEYAVCAKPFDWDAPVTEVQSLSHYDVSDHEQNEHSDTSYNPPEKRQP